MPPQWPLPGEQGQQALLAWFNEGDTRAYKIRFPNGTVDVFRGWVSSIGKAVTAKDVITRTVKVTNVGRPSMAEDRSTVTAATGMTVTPASASVVKGKSTTLTVAFQPEGATDKSFRVVSADKTKATVSVSGMTITVKGVAAGKVNIPVVSGNGELAAVAEINVISQSVARFSSASGVEVDKVAEAFGKLTSDPTSGLTAMARQFHNVTAEQIAYVAQLQRSGDEAGALQAANEAATKGFDDQTRRLKENMGTLETWADRTARAFKSMWDSVLDIGRPDTAQGMLEKAEKAFDEADKKWQWYQSRSHRRGKTSAFLANLRGAWEDRANAQLGLSAATLQADLEKAREMAAKDWAESEASRLKYTEEAQKAYERLQTPLEKYTARQEELNKALKDGKILQADYNTLMAAAKKDYEATLKKPKQSGVKVSAGDRQEDSAHAALLTLQAELRTLEKHAGANEKISQQRRDLWKAESQFAVLEEAAQRRQLSAQEKSLLAHKDETLEYKRQLAALGDKVTYQERLNALAQQADKFAQQQRAKRAAIDAKSRGLTDRQAEREATEQRLKEQYGDNPLALNNVMSEQKKTWAAEDQLRGSWMAGLKSGWSEWEESATDSMSQVKSAATQTFDGIAQNMAAMLTGSEQRGIPISPVSRWFSGQVSRSRHRRRDLNPPAPRRCWVRK